MVATASAKLHEIFQDRCDTASCALEAAESAHKNM